VASSDYCDAKAAAIVIDRPKLTDADIFLVIASAAKQSSGNARTAATLDRHAFGSR
jgi:hypothetical protein